MKHTYRFLASYSDQEWLLLEEEVRHVLKVLRLESGAKIEVTDGQGRWAEGTLRVLSKAKAEVVVSKQYTGSPAGDLHILIGAIQSSDFEQMIPGLVELGVTHITSFLQVGTEKHRHSEKVLMRSRKIALSALKQAKRCFLPTISFKASLVDALQDLDGVQRRIVLDPSGNSLVDRAFQSSGSSVLVLGGEKGLDPGEMQTLLEVGFEKVSIGAHVLRARTAAIAGAALVSHFAQPGS